MGGTTVEARALQYSIATPVEGVSGPLVAAPVSEAPGCVPADYDGLPVKGAVVLVDTTRLADCFPAVDYMETMGVPFIVAINLFHGKQHHNTEDVREALAVPDDVPMITTDARDRAQTKAALLELVQHALIRASTM